jgi:hypothetical protein
VSSSGARSSAAALLACVCALVASPIADGAPGARAAEYAPEVETMVVGRGDAVLSGARWVAAPKTAVSASGRGCTVAAGTPLAALAALRRLGGPAFAVRDYGHCSGSPASSASLFVYSLAGQTNRGQSGWVYKVEGRAGSTGAADPSGPEGDGRRISAGQRVLWFWCEARASACQRTLGVSPARTYARAGSRLRVTVTGYDNEGRSVPVAGATVWLGSASATTDRAGHATLPVPRRAGGYWLSAARRGMVPAIPGWVTAR